MITFFRGVLLHFLTLAMIHKFLQMPLLGLLALMSYLLPLSTALVLRKKLPREMRILLGLFIFYIPFYLINFYLMAQGRNSAWLMHIDSLLEYTLLATMFYMWSKHRVAKNIIKAAVVIYLVIWIIAKLSFERFSLYNTFTGPVAELILVGFAVYTLTVFVDEQEPLMLRQPRFWVSVAVILYSVGTVPIFAMANNLLRYPLEVFAKVWAINWELIILENLLFGVAFLSCTWSKTDTVESL